MVTASAGMSLNQVAGDGASALANWLLPAAIGVSVVLSLIAAVVALRERYHRRRRDQLENRLADLESILVRLSSNTGREEEQDSAKPEEVSSISGKFLTPRGPLSTAISMLRQDAGPSLPGPDRVDLRATLYLYDELDQTLTPTDLADGLNLSLRSLQRGLSTSLGCTPRELILAVKMREAKRMLLDDECRVQEAARAVGFDDPFHFSRRFKTYYGVSPSEMQEQRSLSVA
jgi:AraC-like DNA-binding protein